MIDLSVVGTDNDRPRYCGGLLVLVSSPGVCLPSGNSLGLNFVSVSMPIVPPFERSGMRPNSDCLGSGCEARAAGELLGSASSIDHGLLFVSRRLCDEAERTASRC
jgi:hypothetical protein